MARKKHKKPAIKQESVRRPTTFDYLVKVVPFKDSQGNNKLDFKTPSGKPAKQLPVQSSPGSGKRLAVAWQVDMRQVPGETAVLIYINFPKGTPFSYILGPIEIDDSSGSGVDLVWKKIKKKGNVMPGVYFYYEVTVTTQDGSGGTHFYFADIADPMVIVDAGGG